MLDLHDPPDLAYAGRLPPVRRIDPGFAAFVVALVFLPSFVFTRLGLHDEVNPFFVLIWLALGITTTCFVAAAWAQRTWLGARAKLGRAGTVLCAFGWLFGCMTIFGPAHDPHASDARLQNRCRSHLEQISQALLLYSDEHGGWFPTRIEALLDEDAPPEAFICPSTDDVPAAGPTTRDVADAIASGGHLSYVYTGKGLTSATATAKHVLAYEPARNHTRDHPGTHVLFGNGDVEFLEGDVAARFAERMRSGENPPTNWR